MICHRISEGRICLYGDLSRDAHTGRLFLFACPPQYRFFIYFHIGPAPCRQTKIDACLVRAGGAHHLMYWPAAMPICFNPGEWCCIKTAKNGYDDNGSGGPDLNRHVLIQYGLILKILDMFFGWNSKRWLENIYSWEISKILDMKSLILQEESGIEYPVFYKWRFIGYPLIEILLRSPKYISTIWKIRIDWMLRLYAYVWFHRKLSNICPIMKLWIF